MPGAQLTLFGLDTSARARASDPDTSHQAAQDARGLAAQHERAIIRALHQRGRKGGTKDELGADTGLEPVQVARRMAGLRESGAVVDSGRRRKTRSGRDATVWAITQGGT